MKKKFFLPFGGIVFRGKNHRKKANHFIATIQLYMNTNKNKSQDKFAKLEEALASLVKANELFEDFIKDPHSALKHVPTRVITSYQNKLQDYLNESNDRNILIAKCVNIMKEAKENGGVKDEWFFTAGEF